MCSSEFFSVDGQFDHHQAFTQITTSNVHNPINGESTLVDTIKCTD